ADESRANDRYRAKGAENAYFQPRSNRVAQFALDCSGLDAAGAGIDRFRGVVEMAGLIALWDARPRVCSSPLRPRSLPSSSSTKANARIRKKRIVALRTLSISSAIKSTG